ncbi:MAG TPA: hypothetical protein VND96_03810 [Candidatus Micrarchaeaceae archaeon]|nr:hypothetical protein [Candidatus Micrarchaeaceae archaeon]
MEPDDEPQSHSSTSRLRRAVTLGALSVLVLALAGLSYLHPGWTIGPAGAQANTSSVAGSRQLTAVDFVTPSIGWVVVDGQSQDFAVLHTSDAGQTWVRQLTAAGETTSEYLHFFDASSGVVAVLGTQAAIYRTRNGGRTWARQPMTANGAKVLSADFIDADHGWLLTQASTEGEALLRTGDGGRTWVGLGNPVAYSDWAYRVLFSDRTNGWLYSQSASPYAYQSQNGGVTWQRVALPVPQDGWPSSDGAGVSVEARPTKGAGVSVTVVIGQIETLPTPTGSNPRFAPQPANQFQLSSVDGGRSWKAISMPAGHGAIAYFDALNWLWIGSGVQAKSSDAGSTWSPIRSLLVPAPLPESVQVIDATHIWFGAMAGPRPLVEGTDDGGVSWSMFLLPPTAG